MPITIISQLVLVGALYKRDDPHNAIGNVVVEFIDGNMVMSPVFTGNLETADVKVILDMQDAVALARFIAERNKPSG